MVRTDGRAYGHLITEISRMGRLPNFLTHGAPLRARGAPLWSSRQRYYISVHKTTLELAGIGLSRFKPHSIRSASASAAAGSCWHNSSNGGLVRTLHFAKYYKKPIQQCNMENWQKFCWTVHGKCKLFVTLCQWNLSQWRNKRLCYLTYWIFVIFALTNTGSKLLMGSIHWMMTK